MKYVLVSGVLLLGFVVLSFLISSNDVIQWDTATFQKINNPHGKIFSKIMVELTKYGREYVWIGVTGFLLVVGKESRKVGVLLVISFLILIPLGTVIKDEVDRPRPISISGDNLLPRDADPSFPSGHAVIVSAGATILLLRFNTGKKLIFSAILGIEALLVCYSRIYVGGHYPLDVVGGILLGTGVACAVIASIKYLRPIFSRIDLMKR